jgi:hypothetical protein
MNDFKQLSTTKKGSVGEKIIRQDFHRAGRAVYIPVDGVGHLIDFFSWNERFGLQAVEVKTKPRRYCADDTGIDRRDWERYEDLAATMPVKLFFVDEVEELIYWQEIQCLRHSKRLEGEMVLFPLEAMKVYRSLTGKEVQAIKRHSSIDYELYRNTERYFRNKLQ